jgi:serine/threonine-protein kinase
MDSSGPSTEIVARVADDRDLLPGQKVGEYVVEEKIGAGGFGTVFRGAHPLIGKVVAIKVLKRQYSADPEMVSRFVAEARAVNQIRHRNIIDIFAFGQLDDGRHYYVMEFLEGEPLNEHLDAVGAMTLADALPILRAIARALDAAHAKGIAHRDLKPENVFLARESDGTVFPKLLDFGIAKLLGAAAQPMHKTRTGAPIGTPFYMSPEQCRGRDVDHRTDIYAFGVVAFAMLTGQVPFDGDDYMEILLKQMGTPPPAPSSVNPALPASVDAGVLWMLAKDPADRPPNLVTAVRGLEDAAAIAGVDVGPRPPSAVLAAASGRGGAQPTPSGVRPLPRASELAQTVSAGGLPAVPVDSNDALDAVDALDALDAPSGRRAGVWIAAVAGAVVVGIAVFLAVRSSHGPDEGPARPPVPAATGPAPVAPPPAAPPASPGEPAPLVTVKIAGPPEGTEVYGAGGALLGVAPGPIQLPRAADELVLTLRADGYVTASAKIRPDADRALEIHLVKKTTAAAGRPPAGHGHGSAAPGGTAGSGRDTVEDPFKQ